MTGKTIGRGIVQSTLILTIANIINRLLGFGYRIYMSNLLGSEGMGLFQLIMPIYGLAWSISCSGFTTSVSKLVAAEKAKGQYGNMGRILKQALAITTSLGLILTITLFFLSDIIAIRMFNDERLSMALKILSLSFPFMAAGSCVRGYFMGLQETVIPAISQVFEQCVRMSVIFLLAASMMPRGLAYATAAAMCGIFAGEVLSFVFVILSYKGYKLKWKWFKMPTISSSESLYMLGAMAIPLTFNRITGSLLSAFENFMLPRRLVDFGMTNSEALSEFGKISGMAMPLVQFLSALLVSLSISLVPAVSEAMTVGNFRRISNTVSKVMLFTTITGIGSAGVFILLANELGEIIFNQNIAHILILLGIMCPFMYMQTTLSGILNGLGEQFFIFRNSLISSVISIAFIMLAVPRVGITGYIFGSFAGLVVICSLSLNKIRLLTFIEVNIPDWFIKPILSSVLTVLAVGLFKGQIFESMGNVPGLIATLTLSGFMYMILIVLTGCFGFADMKAILNRK